ncbi:protein-L-isoaspartate(D-aspartate) O-methyltransferase [Candidatus Woesearchaeota archaeon]|nr:protein-L-isoaspartate(D-aspartate) O-methyltransferase [Candidatus Woesearchaeota archaeon]
MELAEKKRRLADYWLESGIISDKAVIRAFMHVPRELFVLEQYKSEAYGDYPLPIPAGQTISQPTTVLLITQALELKKGMKVLEVGAGSGYQASIISKVIGSRGFVYATEIIPELSDFGEKNLRRAGIKNALIVNCDGGRGYEKASPYDRIVVSAACPEIPAPLIGQLKDGGILIVPVGGSMGQKLTRLRKKGSGAETEILGDFAFVPLKGKHGTNKLDFQK